MMNASFLYIGEIFEGKVGIIHFPCVVFKVKTIPPELSLCFTKSAVEYLVFLSWERLLSLTIHHMIELTRSELSI